MRNIISDYYLMLTVYKSVWSPDLNDVSIITLSPPGVLECFV